MNPPQADRRPHVVCGVSGGIAAYKACEVVRRLRESGCDVTVVPTPAALEFVGAATWEALSGRRVTSGVFEGVDEVRHVRLGQTADLILVVPATADLMARAAQGRADDLLTSTLLAARCPVVMAPAMHTEMWEHPATRANVATLRSWGHTVIEPDDGRLTGADSGRGRLPDPVAIAGLALDLVHRGDAQPDLSGLTCVVSAGGTREPLDPVRFLGNRSSGKQGYALAAAAAARGARVTLVAANVDLTTPAGVDVVRVSTTAELAEAMDAAAAGADIAIMAAAVADFTPSSPGTMKIKKDAGGGAPRFDLVQTPDVLAGLVDHRRPGQTIVGFAAETGDESGDVLQHARAKLERKRCDLLVVNDVSGGGVFGDDDNHVMVLDADGGATQVPRASKRAVAHAVLDAAVARRYS